MPQPRAYQFYTDNGGQNQLFHCISRVVERRFVFGDAEKNFFRSLLRRAEAFSGVQVVTWTILDNHFHVLVHILPQPPEGYSEAQLLERIQKLYSRKEFEDLKAFCETLRRSASGERGDRLVRKYLQRFENRMHNLSEFMKTLKQRFTLWFNRRHQRIGTLWESRFKSVLVEGDLGASLKVAAYVDLNAVRAGLVEDPALYPWCGYAEAVAGKAAARRGVGFLMTRNGQQSDWRTAGRGYRRVMFGIGEEGDRTGEGGGPGKPQARRGISPEEVRRTWSEGGSVPLAVLLRCRVRYFTDGLVVGSREFVEDYFQRQKEHFGKKRRTGARKMRGGEWEGLHTFRDLGRSGVSPE
jgi:REP element-mobilizing transposase RayT